MMTQHQSSITESGEPDQRDPSVMGSKRVLDPIERISEILFGLIMVLTFTGSLSVLEAGHQDVREMLIGALGCNFAWGIIDGIMYLMSSLAEQARGLIIFHAVRDSAEPRTAHRVIASALPPNVSAAMGSAELETIREHLQRLPSPPTRPRLRKTDWLGALAVFLLVFVSTIPVVLPFLIVHEAIPALRFSNLIAIIMLFITGYLFGRCTNYHAYLMGASMVLLGVILSSMTIALGG